MAQDDSLGHGGRGWTVRAVDWDAVKEDYLYSGMSQRRIAWKHGTTAGTLRKHMRSGDWVRVVPVQPLPRRAGPRGAEPPTPTQKRRAHMVKRLFGVLDAKLRELETRMSDDAPPQSAADAERDVRSLNALARLYAKLVELDQNATPDGREQPIKDGDDADRLRRDLADRLARLDRARDA